jgi:hypothetical protein
MAITNPERVAKSAVAGSQLEAEERDASATAAGGGTGTAAPG